MNELEKQLGELNNLAQRIYTYVEQNDIALTRRRLLILQKLLYIDTNTNAIAKLLISEPRYLDGAAMIMRSIYDIGVNVDWILRDRTNKRLWRWLRDDRKTLHNRLKNIIDIKMQNPRLNSVGDPLSTWQNAYKKVNQELKRTSHKAGVAMNVREESLSTKVKTFSKKSELLYHTLFWLFSTKIHATTTGLQDLITLNPFILKKRTDPKTDKEELEAVMFMRTTLLWYSAHIRQTARYLKTPFVDDAQTLYESHINRKSSSF